MRLKFAMCFNRIRLPQRSPFEAAEIQENLYVISFFGFSVHGMLEIKQMGLVQFSNDVNISLQIEKIAKNFKR